VRRLEARFLEATFRIGFFFFAATFFFIAALAIVSPFRSLSCPNQFGRVHDEQTRVFC
jgi:hypothetical protein